jgi:hypothetical protein
VADYADILNKLNENRRGEQPLRFGLSVYGAAWEDLEKTFTSSEKRLENVESVIYDVCQADQCPSAVKDSGGCKHHLR